MYYGVNPTLHAPGFWQCGKPKVHVENIQLLMLYTTLQIGMVY